ncbi:flavin reductase family protein [Actinocorallia sp. B10E7]|uniref:flavin reductase family protein n=1 Tax=Actinocorallia sp. B10E7 TaxID=3153558 RepID=UPI00325EA808
MGDEPISRFTAGFDTPMLVVTAASGGERSGCLVGFWTQCSIHPARFLVCLSRVNHTFGVAARADFLGVHVLEQGDPGQIALARLFGERTGDEIDKFTRCAWTEGADGVPLLSDARRRMVGRVLDRVDLGDHVGHLLEPVHMEVDGRGAPLGLAEVLGMDAGHPA